jgi:predicted permease
MANDTDVTPTTLDQQLYPALIQCFVIIGMGYIAGQLNLLTNTHSTGLSRYISNFALPAVIFKNLVAVNFENLSWAFLGSVLLAKIIVFILTGILTAAVERPINYGTIGLYPIAVSQTNDFALILPIIDAVYKDSHPDYLRYIYLISPISLVILNPFGFLFIEYQKRIDKQKKNPNRTWNRWQMVRKLLFDTCRNPVIVCTILGILFNQILNHKLPYILDQILIPISQSFSGVALFYLGLTMVGKLSRLNAHLVITVFLLCIMKLVLFPLILRQATYLLVPLVNGSRAEALSYSDFGFLYGTAPTAPSVIFYVPRIDCLDNSCCFYSTCWSNHVRFS